MMKINFSKEAVTGLGPLPPHTGSEDRPTEEEEEEVEEEQEESRIQGVSGWQGLGKRGSRVLSERKDPQYAVLSRNVVLLRFEHF